MTTLKLILREDRVNKSGEAPLYIRMIKNRKIKYFALNFRLPPKFWNKAEQKIKRSYPNASRLNAWLKTKVSETLNVVVELQEHDKDYRIRDVKEHILGSASPVFLEYARKYTKQAYFDKGKEPTYERYCGTLNKLEAYLHNPEQVVPLIPVQRVPPLPEQAVPLWWFPAGASCATFWAVPELVVPKIRKKLISIVNFCVKKRKTSWQQTALKLWISDRLFNLKTSSVAIEKLLT